MKGTMKVSIVGKLVEHADGTIDLYDWTIDCDCCSTLHEAVVKHREQLITLAQEAGTYTYEKAKPWRPEGWKNPHPEPKLEREIYTHVYYDIFEAGADAMLKELKEKGAWMTPEQMKLLAPERAYPYGWIVFIPEEKSEEGSTGESDTRTHRGRSKDANS